MRKIILILGLYIINSTYNLFAQCRLDYQNFDLVFEDNFDTYSTTNDMLSTWQFTPCGNNELLPENDGWANEYYSQEQVTLQPDGILRLKIDRLPSPITLPGRSNQIYYKSGMIQTICDSLNTWPPENGSNAYGMFEIRAKIPSGIVDTRDVSPSFWLYSGTTEIDLIDANTKNPSRHYIAGLHYWSGYPDNYNWNMWDLIPCDASIVNAFDCLKNYQTGDKVHYKGNCYVSTNNITRVCCGAEIHKDHLEDLSENFNVYSAVWSPTQVTFFINGREIYTMDLITTSNEKVKLIASIGGIFEGSNLLSDYMDIDYIKVWQFNSNNNNLPYKTENEWMYNNIQSISSVIPKVNNRLGSITVNTNTNNELFYIGTNNKLYKTYLSSNGEWLTNKINFYAPTQAYTIQGDLLYHPNKDIIIYRGGDNRLHYVKKILNVYYHWWIDDNFVGLPNISEVSTNPNSIAISPNGDIVYIGKDNKIHIYHFKNGNWKHKMPNYTYGQFPGNSNADYALGDIVCDKDNNIIYKGFDNRIQIFRNINGIYTHSHIDNYWNTSDFKVNSLPGSIITTIDNGILFRGTDDKLHRFYWVTSSPNYYAHQLIPHTYGNTGYQDADKILGNIKWDEFNKRLIYRGYDGRLQLFSLINNNWTHYWYDDYWTTDLYSSIDKLNPNYNQFPSPSISVGNNGEIFYAQKFGNLSMFKWQPCEKLNPYCIADPFDLEDIHLRKR